MFNIGNWSLKNQRLIYFLVLAICIGGILGTIYISKLEDPKIAIKEALVAVIYPGANAHQIELDIVDPVEQTIKTINNVESVESTCYSDLALIKVRFDRTTPKKDIPQSFDMLRKKMSDYSASLPEGASLTVNDSFGDVYGMFFVLTGEGYTPREISRYANLIKRRLQVIPGVSNIELFGEHKECVNILVDRAKMANLGVLPTEILGLLSTEDVTAYAGYMNTGGNRVRITVDGKFENIESISNLLVQGHQDDQIKISDIATIQVGDQEPARQTITFNGKPGIAISVSGKDGTDIVRLDKEVRKELESIDLPAGIQLESVFSQPKEVVGALSVFATNLIESVIIVIAILMLTMGIRSGIMIGQVLIISILGSLLALFMADGSLQRVSLGTFILAMGMLVDNAIVIVDGIITDLQMGKPLQEALTSICKKTAWPLLCATLIAIFAFLPPYITGDTVGEYLHDLFIVLAVSLMLSWVLALTYIPAVSQKFLKVKPVANESDIYSNKSYKILYNVLNWTLHNRTIFVVSALALVGMSIYHYTGLPQEFFPDMEYNQIFIEYKMPEGTSQYAVDRDLMQIEEYLSKRSDVVSVTKALGGTPSRYNLVRPIAHPSLAYGELIVNFTDNKTVLAALPGLQNYLSTNYPQAKARAKRYNLMFKPYSIELEFKGPDPAVLKSLTSVAMQVMQEEPNVQNVSSNWDRQTPVLKAKYDQSKARLAGVSRKELSYSFLAATEGLPIGTLYNDDYTMPIYIKVVEDEQPLENFEQTPVITTLPPLDAVDGEDIKGLVTGSSSTDDILEKLLTTRTVDAVCSDIDIEFEEPVVFRADQQRAMRAQCDPVFGVSTETARKEIEKKLENVLVIPEGYSMSWQGEKAASTESMSELVKKIPVAIFIILALIIALFKDYRRPAIIFLCLPLLAIGIVYGIMISGKSFGFVAICGCLGLIGMLIKNAIILIDEIDAQMASGIEPVKALIDSSMRRFRPVMMASLTTILGMIPLLRDCLFGSLAVTIIGGLFVGTLITLIAIPVLYSIFFKIQIEK
ncbi:MAG: efflux RND transporter permease subunit [Bacteroidaceae bacterium]|nr:efflux RND transporter permease subunit [Bacteroidaceae bacterium]